MTYDVHDMKRLEDPAIWADFLCAKYVQRSDPRQKSMRLQYMDAETMDLAMEIANYIKRTRINSGQV